MGIGNGNLALCVEVSHLVVHRESPPAVLSKEPVDLLQCGGNAFDCRLLDDQPHPPDFFHHTEKLYAVAKQLIVQEPTLKVGDGRSPLILIHPVKNQQPKEVRPSHFQIGVGLSLKPDLMLIALVIGRAAQRFGLS